MGLDKKKILTGILVLITLIAVSVTIWALFFRNTTSVLTPDYAPQEEEQYAEEIPDDNSKKLEQPEGGGAVSLTYSKDVSIDLSEKIASLVFANPSKSNQDMVLQIVVQDTVIVQSGTLKPGNQVKSLALINSTEQQMSAGTYEGKFNVLYYDQTTGEKAIVNTEIPVTITVTD